MDGIEQYIDTLKHDVEKRIGNKPYNHGDFTELVQKVFADTREMISATTLKRMWGYLQQETPTPQIRTLNVLSTFVGHKGWKDYCIYQDNKNSFSSEFVKFHSQHCFLMKPGEMVKVTWYPERTVVLRHEGDSDLFTVMASENSKLEVGMTLHCDTFTAKDPLLLKDVKGGSLIESCDYICGKIGGIEFETVAIE